MQVYLLDAYLENPCDFGEFLDAPFLTFCSIQEYRRAFYEASVARFGKKTAEL